MQEWLTKFSVVNGGGLPGKPKLTLLVFLVLLFTNKLSILYSYLFEALWVSAIPAVPAVP